MNEESRGSEEGWREGDWIDWHELERSLPLDALPGFHRAFLSRQQPEVDWQAAPLRQVQGKVQAALKRLEREGLARREGGALFVAPRVFPEGYGNGEGDAPA